ncbi:MAG: TlpA family protein disulfide reductase [Spirochaetaceae bacterium]|jgi:peroxiredoxin|nr:TlpA family protein disulfide reductase [Spirochaetaceae bacterium]
MNNMLLLALCLTMVSYAACADSAGRMDVGEDVKKAFAEAGLPLLNAKQPAPDWTLKAVDGDAVTLSQLTGQVVFLNFWATWCPPCRAEMPSMEALYQRFKDRGLALVAVDLMEREDVVRNYLRENGLTFPVLLDTRGLAGGQYGVKAVPTTCILDRDGTMIAYAAGARDWNTEKMIAAFEKLLSRNVKSGND